MPTERITASKLQLTDFRGFRDQRTFELGRVTLLLGRNGLGKTTVFDAIDWALFGRGFRLGSDHDGVCRNLWKPAPPQVTLTGDGFSLTRTERGASLNGDEYDAKELVTDPSVFNDTRALLSALRGLSYLSQDTLRELAVSDPEDRATLLRALTGVPLADTVRTGIKKVFQKLDESTRESARASHEAQQRISEVSAEILELEHKRLTEEEPVRREASLILGDRAMTAPIEQVVGSLSELGRQATQAAGAAVEKITRGRSLRERIVAHVARASQCWLGVQSYVERRGALESAVAAQVFKVEAAEKELLECGAAHRLAVTNAEALRARRAELELASQRNAEARATRSQMAEVSAALPEVTNKAQELKARAAELAHRFDEARARAADAAAAWEEVQRRARAHSLLEKARSAVSLSGEQLEEAKIALQHALARANQEKSVEAELAAAVARERERAAQFGTIAERVVAAVRELSTLQRQDACECLLCGHAYSSPEELHSAITRALERTSRHVGDIARLQTLDSEYERARDSLKRATFDVERQRARVQSLTALHEGAQRELSSAQATYGDVAPLGEGESDRAEAELTGRKREASSAGEASRRAESEFEKASSDLARQVGLVRSLEDRLASIGTIDTDDRIVQADLTRAAADVRTAAERVAAADAAQRRAANARDGLATELARARKERDAVDAELRGLERTNEELQVAGIGLLAAAREMGVDRATLEEMPEPLNAYVAVKEAEATATSERAATCSGLVTRMSSLLRTAELPRLKIELASLTRIVDDAAATQARLDKARGRLGALRDSMEASVQRAAEARLNQSDASVNEILSLLTPHRHLNIVRILRDGTLRIGERGLAAGVDPKPYSSAGQLTCLALSLFLGVSLLQAWSRLNVIMLDEPVQHLDDVKFLNFVEVLKRVAQERQVIVSTADRNIGDLLKLKMQRWGNATGNRVVAHEFVDFDRETGPILSSEVGGRSTSASAGA
ncbi:AAA family ATPase [Anaeromyxobacter terrae]|uniref:AAA family ATPase n=1 Tax=Anaeromyxobacter terrae TaxID=2925406 RepID=UPI00243644B8|nr:AAA family ATPase [Anaeromyxobacter sp. SG22]